jgi:hypothetical protein
MDTLQIRAYNVRFGDAILISVPDRGSNGVVETRHILIDVGNKSKKGEGEDEELIKVFKPVLENILEVLDGKPLDLYILTHEHLDHAQGLFFAEKKIFTDSENYLREKLKARYVWLTASAEGKAYYDRFPEAKERHLAFANTYLEINRFVQALAASPEGVPEVIEAMWLNNNLWMNNPRKTDDCVDYIQKLTDDPTRVSYVHREFDLKGHHPFHETNIELWAPEEDTTTYYGKFRPMTLAATSDDGPEATLAIPTNTPPPGVDAGAFYNLINMRRGYFENLLAIDKAANNTSVVFCLEWRGWRLLFAADAEERSWKEMGKRNVLKPVHFIKVSHHGSHNGTPDTDLLDTVFPPKPHDDRPRCSLVSTYEGVYGGVPDDASTLGLIEKRCDRLYDTREETPEPGDYVDIEFQA